MGYRKLTNQADKEIWVNLDQIAFAELVWDAGVGKNVTTLMFSTGLAISVKETLEEIFEPFRSN